MFITEYIKPNAEKKRWEVEFADNKKANQIIKEGYSFNVERDCGGMVALYISHNQEEIDVCCELIESNKLADIVATFNKMIERFDFKVAFNCRAEEL